MGISGKRVWVESQLSYRKPSARGKGQRVKVYNYMINNVFRLFRGRK
jgi:hypothetical protein